MPKEEITGIDLMGAQIDVLSLAFMKFHIPYSINVLEFNTKCSHTQLFVSATFHPPISQKQSSLALERLAPQGSPRQWRE